MTPHRIHNFSAGPSALPLEVLQRAHDEFFDLEGAGMSVMEMSHRSKEFERVRDRAESGIRRNLNVPDDYAVLFIQGGASLQFSMVPMNLCLPDRPVDFLDTGIWTNKARQELEKLSSAKTIAPNLSTLALDQAEPARVSKPGAAKGLVRLVFSGESVKYRKLPQASEMVFDPSASYVHMCSNNTVYGSQWRAFPQTGSVPLVCDMSSDIASRRVDMSQFGLVFAGAQKNLGPAGVTLVIVRKELAERAPASLPTLLQYRTYIKEDSMANTPPTFGIYLVALTMDWLAAQGGVEALEVRNEKKAQTLYKALDESPLFYAPVDRSCRSRMNVVFRVKGDREDLEKKFAAEAEAAGLSGLKGHRSAGGLRASIYNAVTQESVEALVEFIRRFEKSNS